VLNTLTSRLEQIQSKNTRGAPVIADGEYLAYEVEVVIPAPAAATPASRSAAPSGTATPVAREPTSTQQKVTVSEITSLFLKTLYDSAADFIGTAPTGVVISCPAFFDDEQRAALRDAAAQANIPVMQLLDETAAALVAYRVGLVEERKERKLLGSPEEGDAGEMESRDKTVAVVDLGETSLNVTIAQTGEGEYVKLGQHRDETLGGRVFDDLVRQRSRSAEGGVQLIKVALLISSAGISLRSLARRQRLLWMCRANPIPRSPINVPT